MSIVSDLAVLSNEDFDGMLASNRKTSTVHETHSTLVVVTYIVWYH